MKKLLTILAISTLAHWHISTLTFAQPDASKWGTFDPEIAKNKWYLYNEFFVFTKNYEKAFPRWRWLFQHAPRVDKRIYPDGVFMVKRKVEELRAFPRRQGKMIDTLLIVYDQWIKSFGQKGKVLGLKAIAMFEYRRNTEHYREILDISETSIRLEGNRSMAEVLNVNFKISVAAKNNNMISKDALLKNFAENNTIIGYNILNKPQRASKYIKVRNYMFQMARKPEIMIILNCRDIESGFTMSFEKHDKDEGLWPEMYHHLKEKDCMNELLFLAVGLKLFDKKPGITLAAEIKDYYYNHKKYENAAEYYKKMIGLETDRAKKATYCFELGDLYLQSLNHYVQALTWFKKGILLETDRDEKAIFTFRVAKIYAEKLRDKDAARHYAFEAAKFMSGWGEPYLFVGNLYVASINECEPDTNFESKVLTSWAAIDQYEKAKSVDAGINVNEKIEALKQMLPSLDELAEKGLNKDDSYPVGCWINTRVTIRSSEEESLLEEEEPDETIKKQDDMIIEKDTGGIQYYIVKQGDTLYSISRKFNITVAKLRELNGLKDNSISIGGKLAVSF